MVKTICRYCKLIIEGTKEEGLEAINQHLYDGCPKCKYKGEATRNLKKEERIARGG